MKTKIAILLLIVLAAGSLTAAPPKTRDSAGPMAAAIDNATFINVNRILMFVTNHGNFGRDLTDMFGHDAGTYFPYTSIEDIYNGKNAKWANYASGLWVGGKVNGEIRVAIAEYEDEYVPGYMENETFTPDRPEYKVYKLYRDSLAGNPNADYTNWPVDQGAPTRIDTVDGEEMVVPDMIGDQMLWAVYNDADPSAHTNNAGETAPLGIEIKQTTFAFDRQGSLGNIIFLKFQVFNKGGNTIDSCFFSLWADPDLGGAGDDLVGSDTLLSLGYVYNATNSDVEYGATPPALGYDFFQGPLLETGDEADTARMWDTLFVGYQNMGMVSFNKYINGTDPENKDQTYQYMKGLDASQGGIPYEYNGQVTTFFHSGDPVAGTGDLDASPADRRFMLTTGPITFEPGDSTEILAAIIIGQGANRLNSITVMKTLDAFAQKVYEDGFNPPAAPAAPVVRAGISSGQVILAWGDTSEVDPGDYEFEGYTVWQGVSAGGPWTEIATFDLDNDRDFALIDTLADPYSGLNLPVVMRALTNSGLQHAYVIDRNYITGGELNDVTEYFFRVTAFSFSYLLPDSSEAPAGDRFQESQTIVRVRPHTPMPGVFPAYDPLDTLEVDYSGVSSDVLVYPLVLDWLGLTGHTYQVEFVEIEIGEGETDTVWNLVDVTADETLIEHETNLSGDGNYIPTDGFQVVVISGEGIVAILETAGAGGTPIVPPDNVMYSLNSTRDWYMDTQPSGVWSRLNWLGTAGVYDYEIRFTADSSQYYQHGGDGLLYPNLAPFEIWNVGIGTPDDPSDDVRLQISVIDDDASGGWSYGDRIYAWTPEYVEPLPPNWDHTEDSPIGRMIITDYSGATTAPAEGTVIRFVTAKVPVPGDVATFVATAPGFAASNGALDSIRVVPNPFYLFGPYDNAVGNYNLFFHGLPAECTIDIYNLAGEWVDEIRKEGGTDSYATWDLLTRNGVPVSSGIYIYVVDAPGFGQKIGKFAVFVETEVLKQY